MDNKLLFKVLQLDSLTGLLSTHERISIHMYNLGHDEPLTYNIVYLYEWIEANGWEPPKMKYGHDCFQYFYDPDSEIWLTADYYIKKYSHYYWKIQPINKK